MFQQRVHRTTASSTVGLLELIYVGTVRRIRKGEGLGPLGLLTSVLQTLIMIGVFFGFFSLLGLRGSAIRGDFLLYIMSGVFIYITHVKAISGVFSSDGPTSPMMQHAPMNTLIAIAAGALSSLYLQLLAMGAILFVYHAAFVPITIHEPIAAAGLMLLAWFSGVAIGIVFLALKPFAPRVVNMIKLAYQRLNMIASGKMFVVNSLPGWLLPYFDWNPLFHIIDQLRGHVFLNYNPHFTTLMYPIYVTFALLIIGLILEYAARRKASLSWAARV